MKILIGTPAYKSQVNVQMVRSMVRACMKLKENNHSFTWDTPSSSILSYNRNVIVHHAIKDEFDWILFWDGDIAVHDDDFIQKMLQCAYKYDAAIVGLPVALKGDKRVYNFANKVKDKGYVNFEELPAEAIPVEVIGTGVMLIRVSAVKGKSFPIFRFVDTYHSEPGFFPEDWNFCENMAYLKEKIYMLPLSTSHFGEMEFK